MPVLVIVEHNCQKLNPNTEKVLAAALQLDKSPTVLIIGSDCQAVAEEARILAGVGKVLLANNPCYKHLLAENLSKLIASISSSYQCIMAPSTTFGKNLMPRLAACLGVPQVSDVCKILDEQTFEHPTYAGNVIETVRFSASPKVLTIRDSAFQTQATKQVACPIEHLETIIEEKNTRFVKHELNESERPDLSSAKVVVSGGRGLQSAEKFKLIEQLADALNAAVGASRAAVDAGFVSNEYQVGQTGRVVAPDLYIAIGISGAVQHLAGMKDSKVIVAINKDVDAPIFEIADYALVGDLFELVPELIEALKTRKTL